MDALWKKKYKNLGRHPRAIELKPYPKVQTNKRLKCFYPINPCSEFSGPASAASTITHLLNEGRAPLQKEMERQVEFLILLPEMPHSAELLLQASIRTWICSLKEISTLNKVGLREEGR